MIISARNQFRGKVKTISSGAVNDEIVIAVSTNTDIVATITESSTKKLALTEGADVVVLVKASSIVLAIGADRSLFLARNQIPGVVSVATKGAVNSDVVIDAGDNLHISVTITNISFDNLGLKVGATVIAVFKASSVIVVANSSS